MNLKYLLGAIISIPCLPIMYIQGKQIRKNIPELAPATGNQGLYSVNSTKELNLLVIGESTIAGIGVKTHEEGFAGTLAKEWGTKQEANIRWKVYAQSGYTAKDVTAKLIPQISETAVDLIVVGLGGNDAFTLNWPGRWKRDIEELIGTIRMKFPHAPIAFTNMPPIKSFPAFTPLIKFTIGNLVEILGDELAKLASTQENVYYNSERLTLEDWIVKMGLTNTEPSDFFSDGVHPSRLTYQTWAKDFADFVTKNIDMKKWKRL